MSMETRGRVRERRTERICLRIEKQAETVLEMGEEKDNVESSVTPRHRIEATGGISWPPIVMGICSARLCLVEHHMTLVFPAFR